MEEEYYRVLGLERGATAAQIKRAYRVLVRVHHPDLNPDNPEAERQFKRLSEANEVLSDPERRARYDRECDEGLGLAPVYPRRAPSGGLLRFLGSLLGSRRQRGADLQTELRLDFSDAIVGTTTELSVPRRQSCRYCRGSVRGCRACAGSGQEVFEERLRVRIPPGVNDGGMVRIEGKGYPGYPPGNLLVVTRVRPHPCLSRQDRDIFLKLPISVWDAVLGANIDVATVNGGVTLRIPEGSQHGQKLRLRGLGVPARNGSNAGDQLIELQVIIPRKLDQRSRMLVEQLQSLQEHARTGPVEE